ncbi:MAG: Bug family tripartite tricarboxylate transporter substrate binding protein [Xanthobacteraceae bacterium]
MRIDRSLTKLLAPGLLGLAAAIAVAPATALAQADFYKGKSVELIISTGAGAGHDANARMVARYLGNHIPGNPTIVPKNMPGAGHIRAANYVFSQAPKDGTTIGTFIPIFVMAQILGRSKSIQFNPARFEWLMSTSSSNSTVYVWHTSGVKSLEDARTKEVLMGGTGVGSYTVIYPTVMNSVLGTKFKLVMGYKSTSQISIALERGEIQGRAGNNFNSLKVENGEWLRDHKINLLAQVGLARDPEFAKVPLLTDFAKTDADRQLLRFFSTDVALGRPFVTSPGVPAERVAMLRKAFDSLMKDKAFLADMDKSGLGVGPVAGIELQKIVGEFMQTPTAVIEKAKLAMEPKNVVKRAK